ncbi:hypothetical protein EDC01DRAFT_633099 [Geopyxis carbonaria]|nr:hypothetical protein EDC01DRAFT_633099 [Geopyxis carbonaria]
MIQARQTSSIGSDERVSKSSLAASISSKTSMQPTRTSTASQSKQTSAKADGNCSRKCDLSFNTISPENGSVPKDCKSESFVKRVSECHRCNPKANEIMTIATYCKWDSAYIESNLGPSKFGVLETTATTRTPGAISATATATVEAATDAGMGSQVKLITGILLAFIPALVFTGAYFLFKRYRRTRRVAKDEETSTSNMKSKNATVDSDDDSLYAEEYPKDHDDSAEPPPELGPHPSETPEAARARQSWRWSWRKSARATMDFTVKDGVCPKDMGQEKLPQSRELKKQPEQHRGSMLSVTTIQSQHAGEDRTSQYDLTIEIVNERGSPSDDERSSIAIMRLDIEPRPMSSASRPPSRLR